MRLKRGFKACAGVEIIGGGATKFELPSELAPQHQTIEWDDDLVSSHGCPNKCVQFMGHAFSCPYNNMGLWFRGIMFALHAKGPGFDSLRVHLFYFFFPFCVV